MTASRPTTLIEHERGYRVEDEHRKIVPRERPSVCELFQVTEPGPLSGREELGAGRGFQQRVLPRIGSL